MDERYHLAAEALAYPRSDPFSAVEQLRAALARDGPPEVARLVEGFAARIATLSLGEVQELYTRTFDLDPVSSLEVGWHLYGENYSRGEFLVKMRRELRRHGLEEASELPDHLTHVLPLLGSMAPAEAQALAAQFVLPALDKMLAGFGDRDDPYRELLYAIRCLIASGVANDPESCSGGTADAVTPATTSLVAGVTASAVPPVDPSSPERGLS
jgi:nitrate reductase delta subunit